MQNNETKQLASLDVETLSKGFNLAFDYENNTDLINCCLSNVMNNYLKIGLLLKKIKESESYLSANYNDIYEYAFDKFEFSSTTVKNMIKIVERFTEGDNYYSVQFKKEYKNFSISQLTELLSVDEEKLIEFTPDMSVRKIRKNKLLLKIKDDVSNYFNEVIDYIKNDDWLSSLKMVSNFNINNKFDSCSLKLIYDNKIVYYSFEVYYYPNNSLFRMIININRSFTDCEKNISYVDALSEFKKRCFEDRDKIKEENAEEIISANSSYKNKSEFTSEDCRNLWNIDKKFAVIKFKENYKDVIHSLNGLSNYDKLLNLSGYIGFLITDVRPVFLIADNDAIYAVANNFRYYGLDAEEIYLMLSNHETTFAIDKEFLLYNYFYDISSFCTSYSEDEYFHLYENDENEDDE